MTGSHCACRVGSLCDRSHRHCCPSARLLDRHIDMALSGQRPAVSGHLSRSAGRVRSQPCARRVFSHALDPMKKRLDPNGHDIYWPPDLGGDLPVRVAVKYRSYTPSGADVIFIIGLVLPTPVGKRTAVSCGHPHPLSNKLVPPAKITAA